MLDITYYIIFINYFVALLKFANLIKIRLTPMFVYKNDRLLITNVFSFVRLAALS
jgi:hypothetical protein